MAVPSTPLNTLDLSPGTLVHGHRLVRMLGQGQMGEVYEATAQDGRRVAIKIVRAEALAETGVYERLMREAKLCVELDSPHVVPVLDHGLHRGRPLIVMPLLAGHDLEHWSERVGPLRPDIAIAITLQVCAGLAVAHARGAVHRDLKPANVFLAEGERESLRAVVCDFGVAKIVDEDGALTASGAVLGTPLYMSPEQLLDSKRVDARCDVWAVGMTLYSLLAGRTAHGEVRTIGDLVLALSTNDLTPLQVVAPWVSPALARVVHAALLPRDKRFQTITDLASALQRWSPRVPELVVSSIVGPPADLRSSVAPIATLPNSHADLGAPDDATVSDAAASGSTLDPLVGKVLAGSYRLVRQLGAGGMGAVYEAIDRSGGRSAVKVMHADTSRADDASRRFLREMRAVRAIDSPHVVRPLDYGVDETLNIPYFAMELLSGRDLASVLATAGSLAPAVAVELFAQACSALHAAHVLGIVHRDIKPSNLFLHEPGDGTVVLKVCDFGIAKRIETDGVDASTELTRTGGLLGSPIYMSPEHAKNAKNVDARSDVWSLGLSLHEALSGMRPWQGCTSIGEVIVAICTEPVPSLTRASPWIDGRLASVVERTLVRDASQRCPSIAEFARALGPFRLGRPVRVEDLKPAENAASGPSARASSVRPPGMVTSGSLAAAARPALDATVTLPLEKSSPWKWGALAAAVGVLAVGGAFALRTSTPSPAGDPSARMVSGSAPPASVDVLPSAAPSVSVVAAAPSSPSSSPSAIASALPSTRPVSGAVRLRPGLGAAANPNVTSAQGAPPAPVAEPTPAPAAPAASPVPSAKSPSRSDGRTDSRKD